VLLDVYICVGLIMYIALIAAAAGILLAGCNDSSAVGSTPMAYAVVEDTNHLPVTDEERSVPDSPVHHRGPYLIPFPQIAKNIENSLTLTQVSEIRRVLSERVVGETFSFMTNSKDDDHIRRVSERFMVYYAGFMLGEPRYGIGDHILRPVSIGIGFALSEFASQYPEGGRELFRVALGIVSTRESQNVESVFEMDTRVEEGVFDFVVHDFSTAIADIVCRRIFFPNEQPSIAKAALERIVANGRGDMSSYPIEERSVRMRDTLLRLYAGGRAEVAADSPPRSDDIRLVLLRSTPLFMTVFHTLHTLPYIPERYKDTVDELMTCMMFLVESGVPLESVWASFSDQLLTNVGSAPWLNEFWEIANDFSSNHPSFMRNNELVSIYFHP